MILTLLSGAAFSLLGLFLFIKPDLVWMLTERWKSCAADEPSDLYRKSTQLGGILFILLGLAMIVLPFVLQ